MYRLDSDGKPVAEPDSAAWGRWFEAADRIVAQDTVCGVRVSTVFLGLDHNVGEGAPLLWETMTFMEAPEPAFDDLQERYATSEGALAGHNAMVARVKERRIEEP